MNRFVFPVAAALLACAVEPASALTWSAATEYPQTAMPGRGLQTFATLLAQETKGRITLAPGFDGGPGKLRSAAIIQAVKVGSLDVGDSFSGALASLDPVFQIPSLPFLATTDAEAHRLYRMALPEYRRAFERNGQTLLYVSPWPPSGIWSRKPVRDASDVRGLAIRTYDATSTAVMRQAQAAPQLLSFGDTMGKLRDGSLDAVLSSGDGGAGHKLWAFTRNFTEIGYAQPLSFTTVATKDLDALSPALRAAVLKAAAETEAAQWHILATRVAQNYAAMRQNGVTIIAPSKALKGALADAGRTTVDTFMEGASPQAVAIVKSFRKAN